MTAFQEISKAIQHSETRADMREPLLLIAEMIDELFDEVKKLKEAIRP